MIFYELMTFRSANGRDLVGLNFDQIISVLSFLNSICTYKLPTLRLENVSLTLLFMLVKVGFSSWFDILPLDFDVLITISSRLLVIESQGMKNFMYRSSQSCSTVVRQRDVLFSTDTSHKTPTSKNKHNNTFFSENCLDFD